MKKLIAMIGAVAMSFGLFADATPNVTSFEANDVGCSGETFDWFTAGWSYKDGEAVKFGAYTVEEPAYEYTTSRREDEFVDKAVQTRYLDLETGKETLTKAAAEGDIFLDELVKFTGFEEDQEFTTADGTKIAVWMRSDEGDDAAADPETTNKLYITVGRLADGVLTPVNLQIGADNAYEPGVWYRLTIRSIGNVLKDGSRTGFIVYIDGNQVSSASAKYLIDLAMTDKATAYMAAGQLFPSFAEEDDGEFNSVGFKGIGAIDDMIVDANGPDFAQTLDIAPVPPTGALVDVVKVGDVEIPCLDGSYTVAKGVTVRVYLKGVEGKYVDPTFKDFQDVSGETDFSDFSGIEVKDYVACISMVGVDDDYGKTVEETIAKVQALAVGEHEDVEVEILTDCSSGDVLDFKAGTAITIAQGGNWTIDLEGATEAEIANLEGIPAGKTVVVSGGALTLGGAIAAGASLEAEDVVLGDELEVAGDFAATSIDVTDAQMTLVGDGTVVSGTQIGKAAFENPADDVVETQVGDNWVYTLQQFVPVCEINGKKYATLADAVGEAQATDTIKILMDIALDDWVLIEKTVTIDLNGCKLEPSANWPTVSPAHDAILAVKHGGNLTITDSLTGGTIDGSSLYAAVKLTISGDEVDEYTDANKAVLVVNGGHLIGNYAGITGNGSAKRGNCDVTVNGGLIEGTALNDNAGIFFPCYGNLTINGGTVQGAMGVYLKAGRGEVTVGSATIKANGAKGAFVAKGDGFENTGDAFVVDNAGYVGGTPDPDIAAGTFISANGAAVASYAQGTLEPVAGFVTGGTFTGAVKIDDAIAGGTYAFGPFTPGEEQTMVEAVAKIGTVNYGTLDAAIAAATTDDTVTLVKDLTLTATLDIAKSVAIDLNQKTVTFAANLAKGINAPNVDLLEIKNGTITVADGRTNIAYSRAIYLLHTSAVFKDLVIDLPGFEYVINKDCDTEPDSDCWNQPLAYTLDCENVVVNGNGSLFHIENAEATLTACATTFDATLPSFGGAHEAAIYSSCGAVTTVDGGLFTAPNALQTGNYGGDIIVKGGEFNGNIKSWMLDNDTRDFANVNKANIQIEGGKFTGNFVYADNCSEESPLLTVVISGGDFSDKTIPVEFIEQKADKVAYWADSTIKDYVTPAWKDVYAITFKVEGAADYVTNVVAGTELATVKPADPVKEDYKFTGWDPEVTGVAESNATYTATFEPIASGITITVTLGTGIASVTVDDQTITESGEVKLAEAGDVTITLTAVDTIKIPVFKVSNAEFGAQGTAKSKAYTVADGNTFTFSAEEAEIFDPEVSDDVAKQAIKDVAPEAAEKVDAVTTGEGAVNPKALAAWINAKSAGDVATALAGDYVKASVALDVAPITEATEIEIKDLSTGAAGAMTFEVDINDVAAVEAIKDMVEASSDLGAWDDHKLETTATYAEGKVTITPKAATDKAFMKVVIPQDAK